MMFGYEVNEHVTLKILEEREAEQLFKLVDSNRDYLGEFLPFVEYTTEVAHSKKFIQSALEQRVATAFIVGYGMMMSL